ncbi:hypothetical protein HA466_0278700 [Hirschfeldia incana]|nr:hypothetical protein HA466_0278700 [Hirschfeldia incana]
MEEFLYTAERAHHVNRVIIATLTKVVLRPRAWPNFKPQYVEMMAKLEKIEWWRLIKEERSANREAFLIAQSAAKGGYGQSYVACGGPFWLRHVFENDEVYPSS